MIGVQIGSGTRRNSFDTIAKEHQCSVLHARADPDPRVDRARSDPSGLATLETVHAPEIAFVSAFERYPSTAQISPSISSAISISPAADDPIRDTAETSVFEDVQTVSTLSTDSRLDLRACTDRSPGDRARFESTTVPFLISSREPAFATQTVPSLLARTPTAPLSQTPPTLKVTTRGSRKLSIFVVVTHAFRSSNRSLTKSLDKPSARP